jgi:hypothetical protein
MHSEATDPVHSHSLQAPRPRGIPIGYKTTPAQAVDIQGDPSGLPID